MLKLSYTGEGLALEATLDKARLGLPQQSSSAPT
jgi:hypothetical protein